MKKALASTATKIGKACRAMGLDGFDKYMLARSATKQRGMADELGIDRGPFEEYHRVFLERKGVTELDPAEHRD